MLKVNTRHQTYLRSFVFLCKRLFGETQRRRLKVASVRATSDGLSLVPPPRDGPSLTTDPGSPPVIASSTAVNNSADSIQGAGLD